MDAVIEHPKKLSRAEAKFIKQKEVVKAAIISATEKFTKANKYDVVAAVDNKIERLQDELYTFYSTVNNSHGTYMAKFFSIVLETPIIIRQPKPKPGLIWTRFAAIMVLNQGGHNYPINKVTIIGEPQFGYRFDGTRGNTLDNNMSYYRPATVEEINAMTDETYAAMIREFLIMD